MICVRGSSAVDRGFETGPVKRKAIRLVCVAFLLSTHHQGERTKTGRLRCTLIYPSGVIFLSADCCVSELTL